MTEKAPQQPTNEVQGDLFTNFNKVIDTPEGVKQAIALMHGETQKQNTMSLNEFKRYERLFQIDGIREMGEVSFKELMIEYYGRINPYAPVLILNAENQVVLELPPIFHRFTPVSSLGQIGIDHHQALINSYNMDSPMANSKQLHYAQVYKELINAANNQQEHAAAIAQAQKMSEKVMQAVGNTPRVESETQPIQRTNSNPEIIPLKKQNNGKPVEDEFEPL